MELRRRNILNYLGTKKPEFNRDYSITKLGLFGSYALGQQTEDSDIDLLIEFAPETEGLSEKKAAIKEFFSRAV